jgi:NAD(P)-dependent dehydrogenase (short-subunit alcohol dehydrogenase family)
MLIATGTLTRQALKDKVVLISGAGGGIGFEAARASVWLGARVVIAEVNLRSGRTAEERLATEWGAGVVRFIHTDVGDERSVNNMAARALREFGHVDVVINNATVAPLGAVQNVPIDVWDASYRVNLRGPVLLARAFLPGMLKQRAGVFVCVSSVGQGYMAAYESLKAAQVHLANTLDTELEGCGISAFTIGPGFVPTDTAVSSIPKLAALMGKPLDEVQALLRSYTLSVEAAGAGFAAAVTLAVRYHGMEISSSQALIDAGIALPDDTAVPSSPQGAPPTPADMQQALAVCRRVRQTLLEQSAGWKERPIFERQWVIRTFRQRAHLSADEWLETLRQMEQLLQTQDGGGLASLNAPLLGLADYYAYLREMAKGYVKDPAQREEQLAIVKGWQDDVEHLADLLGRARGS